MNDWLHFKLEFSPEHIWVIQIQRGRNGQLKYHRRIEAANFPGLTGLLRKLTGLLRKLFPDEIQKK